jgi:hypothetical protein
MSFIFSTFNRGINIAVVKRMEQHLPLPSAVFQDDKLTAAFNSQNRGLRGMVGGAVRWHQ